MQMPPYDLYAELHRIPVLTHSSASAITLPPPPPPPPTAVVAAPELTPARILDEYCVAVGLQAPIYTPSSTIGRDLNGNPVYLHVCKVCLIYSI